MAKRIKPTIDLQKIAKTMSLTIGDDDINFEESHVEKDDMELYRWNKPIKPLQKWGFNITTNLDGSHDCAIPSSWHVEIINDKLAIVKSSHGREIARIIVDDNHLHLHVITPIVFYVKTIGQLKSGNYVKTVVVFDRADLKHSIYTSDPAIIRNTDGLTGKKLDKANRANKHRLNELRTEAMDYIRSTERYS